MKKQTKLSSFFHKQGQSEHDETSKIKQTSEVAEKSPTSSRQNSEKRAETKKQYELLKRKREYQVSWETEFRGLQYDGDVGMTCKYCCQYKELAGPTVFITGSKTFRKTGIISHWESPKHLLAANAAANLLEGQGPMDRIIQKLGQQNKQLIIKLFNTAYFVIHHEMPFTSFPDMLSLQIKNGSDLKRLISYSTDMACRRFTAYIVKALREPIIQSIANVNVLSIMFDGATDSSVSEVEIIYCRFLEHGQPRDVLVGLTDIEHAHAEGVFEAIDRAMRSFAGEDWISKLIGAGCDGASVNLGANNSVATRLMGEQRNYVVPVHCVAHRLELAVLAGIRDNNNLTTINDIFKKIYKHYHYSPKALRELRAIGETMEERVIKPTRLQGTRWLPHIRKASRALIGSYAVIVTHFQHVGEAGSRDATAEVRGRARFVSQKLTDFRVLYEGCS